MHRPRMQRPPSAMSNMRPPSGSRPPSRAASNPEPHPERTAPVKRVPTNAAKHAEQLSASTSSSGPSETNIQVVVRCRDRNKREIEENSGVIIAPGKDGHTITVQTSALTELNNKTYSFDRVFGGGSSQQDIFDNTVEPIVQEMLGGYNCTIFAYGQTGTGKTYTMSGDMSDHCGGVPPATAGIIPRALSRIFQMLDAVTDEWSVKCSFIELYNEELRDLLSSQEDSKVKIFDDSTKKGGIIINGMEELAVNDANHGVKILQEGSRKREVAATKCNEVSSRSHSVFTITVFIKQTSPESEDMMRVGKLNLVDLAGSENVGRSGAENKRAREAGMINQSLLTLGRVINALVDRSQHVPYRESKLTRLLQDSLGGRTKTCIIATLSPAKINMDETVSTLEYANRAKSIKNKPQVNQMMMKKALIKDLVMENERLKADLNATRTKNGVYMTEESHLELVNQNESNKLLTEEQQRKIEAMEQQLQVSKEQFESTMASYTATKKDLEQTSRQLSETENKLQATETTLSETTTALDKETLLRKEHQHTEAQLNTIAASLKSTLDTTVNHNQHLHASVDRRRLMESANHSSWAEVQNHIATVVKSLDKTVNNFSKTQETHAGAIAESMASFVNKEMKLFSDIHEYFGNQINDFESKRQAAEAGLTGASTEMDEVLDEIKSLRKDVEARLGHGLSGLKIAAERIADEIASQMIKYRDETDENFRSLAHVIEQAFTGTLEHASSQSLVISGLKDALKDAHVKNTTLLDRIAHDHLQALEVMQQKAREEEAQKLLKIQEMINSLSASRESRNQKACHVFKQDMQLALSNMQEQNSQQSTNINEWSLSESEHSQKLTEEMKDIERIISRNRAFAKDRTSTMIQSTESIHTETVELVDTTLRNCSAQVQALEEFATKAKTMNQTHHVQHVNGIAALSASADDMHRIVQHGFKKAKIEIKACHQAVLGDTTQLRDQTTQHVTDVAQLTSDVRKHISTDMKQDVPSGKTPKKQEYTYPTTWKTTKSHDELLANYKGSKSGASPVTRHVSSSPKRDVQQQERNPLRDVDVNVTSPGFVQGMVNVIEDELAVPPMQKSSIPAPKSRTSVEKEIVKPTAGAGGQENGVRPLMKRKRVAG